MHFTITDAIRAHFLARPEAPALATQDEVWSFGRLGARVQAVLDHLAQLAAELPAGHPVMVAGHKEGDAVAAMLACMMAGRPFVFLDRANPPARGQRIATLAGLEHTLCAGPPPALAGLHLHDLDRLDSRAFDGAGCAVPPGTAWLYIIFTSGSTGEPKGIPISRGNFAAFDSWYRPMLAALPGQELSAAHSAHVNHASFAFDMGMMDLWPVLALGRPVILLDHRNNVMPFNNLRLLRGLTAVRARSWFSTPSLLQLMCAAPGFSGQTLPGLRCFFLGGEVVQPALIQELHRRFPAAAICHAYGPSEATCMTHAHMLTPADIAADGPVSLGPLSLGPLSLGPVRAPTLMRIVDEAGHALPPGQPGEVELSGPQVVAGYIPGDHPAGHAFGRQGDMPRYRTGDLGQTDAAGNLFLLGRMDRQVKWNGNRIELDEIERAAHEVAGIASAACLPVREAGRVVDILLCVRPVAGADITARGLSQALHQRLPQAMVPRDIHIMAQFPVTVNGKIDAPALMAACRAPG